MHSRGITRRSDFTQFRRIQTQISHSEATKQAKSPAKSKHRTYVSDVTPEFFEVKPGVVREPLWIFANVFRGAFGKITVERLLSDFPSGREIYDRLVGSPRSMILCYLLVLRTEHQLS